MELLISFSYWLACTFQDDGEAASHELWLSLSIQGDVTGKLQRTSDGDCGTVVLFSFASNAS